MTTKEWWATAERECPDEYAVLLSVLSEHSVGKGHDARLRRAREKLFKAMAHKGLPFPETPGVSEARVVSDFNTLNDLIAHAASDLGATHVSGTDAQTKIFFPRGGTYPYEEATVWRKNGYWHAQGPGARTGVSSLPRGATPIASGMRRAAETRKPTIYDALRAKLGREPTNAELKAEVDRIKREALIDVAGRGGLPHQRGRRVRPREAPQSSFKPGDRIMWSDTFLKRGGEIDHKWHTLRKNERGTVDWIQRDGDVIVQWDNEHTTTVHPPERLAHATDRMLESSRRVAEMTHLAEDILDGLGPYLEHEGHDAPRTASRIERMIMSAGRSDKKAEEVLDHVNKLIGGHGVEAVRDENAWDNYYGDVVATYVNMGDTYTTTLLYDARQHTFIVTSWGDWYEGYERDQERQREDSEYDGDGSSDDESWSYDDDSEESRRRRGATEARTKFPEPPKENKEDATEFYRRRNMPGVEVKYIESGPRVQTIELVRRGQTLGTAVKMFTRGKHTSTQYFLPQNIEDPLAGLPVAREGRRGGGDKARGAQYAADQLEGDYFRQWAWGQMVEGAKLDPDKAIHDLKQVARNMLQDVEHDTKRDLNESREFFEGFTDHLRKRETVEWLTKELETMQGEIESNVAEPKVREAKGRKRAPKARKPAKRKPRRR